MANEIHGGDQTIAGRVTRLSPPARYGIAVATTGFAALVRVAFDPLLGGELPFLTFYPAVMVSAWLGGFWPGILTTLLAATIADYLWLSPTSSLAISRAGDVVGLLVFVGMGALISVLNESWRRASAAVSQSEEWLQVTLASIGDGVIATDDQGRVTQLNAVAEALTGWTEADAVGKRLEEVLVVVNEESRRPAERPIGRALLENVIVKLPNPAVLIAKDGRESPIVIRPPP